MLNVEADGAIICLEAVGDVYLAVIGDNGKILAFRLDELPEMPRGKGVKLQSYREGGLRDALTFDRRGGTVLGRHRWPQPRPGPIGATGWAGSAASGKVGCRRASRRASGFGPAG